MSPSVAIISLLYVALWLPLLTLADGTDSPGGLRRDINFASVRAGALILESSRGSKGFDNLLNDDKDKYGITPCANKEKWVVIGLSEHVLIRSVVIVNYEKYSSLVKDFHVYSAITHPVTEWHDLGTYRARAVLGEQVFNLTAPVWGRYLKFDFLSEWGDEHYCTLSQIRVHGSAAMETLQQDMEQNDLEVQEMMLSVIEQQQQQQHGREVIAESESPPQPAETEPVSTEELEHTPLQDGTGPGDGGQSGHAATEPVEGGREVGGVVGVEGTAAQPVEGSTIEEPRVLDEPSSVKVESAAAISTGGDGDNVASESILVSDERSSSGAGLNDPSNTAEMVSSSTDELSPGAIIAPSVSSPREPPLLPPSQDREGRPSDMGDVPAGTSTGSATPNEPMMPSETSDSGQIESSSMPNALRSPDLSESSRDLQGGTDSASAAPIQALEAQQTQAQGQGQIVCSDISRGAESAVSDAQSSTPGDTQVELGPIDGERPASSQSGPTESRAVVRETADKPPAGDAPASLSDIIISTILQSVGLKDSDAPKAAEPTPANSGPSTSDNVTVSGTEPPEQVGNGANIADSSDRNINSTNESHIEVGVGNSSSSSSSMSADLSAEATSQGRDRDKSDAATNTVGAKPTPHSINVSVDGTTALATVSETVGGDGVPEGASNVSSAQESAAPHPHLATPLSTPNATGLVNATAAVANSSSGVATGGALAHAPPPAHSNGGLHMKIKPLNFSCLEGLKYSDFQARMWAKLEASHSNGTAAGSASSGVATGASEGGPPSSSAQDSVFKPLISKIKKLEMKSIINEMYTTQLGECYRSVLFDLMASWGPNGTVSNASSEALLILESAVSSISRQSQDALRILNESAASISSQDAWIKSVLLAGEIQRSNARRDAIAAQDAEVFGVEGVAADLGATVRVCEADSTGQSCKSHITALINILSAKAASAESDFFPPLAALDRAVQAIDARAMRRLVAISAVLSIVSVLLCLIAVLRR